MKTVFPSGSHSPSFRLCYTYFSCLLITYHPSLQELDKKNWNRSDKHETVSLFWFYSVTKTGVKGDRDGGWITQIVASRSQNKTVLRMKRMIMS